jgi:tetratricopeptide (TPR) repeat protein
MEAGLETESRVYLHRSLDMSIHFAAVEAIVDVSLGLSRLYEFQEDLEQAEDYGRRALEFDVSLAVTKDVMRVQLARVLFMRGKLEEGHRLIERLPFVELPRVAQLHHYTLAWASLREGNPEEALRLCARARASGRQLPPGPVFGQGTDICELEALGMLQRYDEGRKKARRLAKAADRPGFLVTARRLEAAHLLGLGRAAEAEAALRSALEPLEHCERPMERERVQSMLAELTPAGR